MFVSGLCHCGVAVTVCVGWKGGGVWCVVCGVWCLLFSINPSYVVVSTVVVVHVMLHCVVGCGMAVCEGRAWSRCLSSLFPFSSSSFSCVGVRGSARAAVRARTLSPNTIVFSCCLLVFFSLLLFAFLHAPPFLCWNGGGVHHVLLCCVGMTAMGSLSRSSAFFW